MRSPAEELYRYVIVRVGPAQCRHSPIEARRRCVRGIDEGAFVTSAGCALVESQQIFAEGGVRPLAVLDRPVESWSRAGVVHRQESPVAVVINKLAMAEDAARRG